MAFEKVFAILILIGFLYNGTKTYKYLKYFPDRVKVFAVVWFIIIIFLGVAIIFYTLTGRIQYIISAPILLIICGLLLGIFPNEYSTMYRIGTEKMQSDSLYRIGTGGMKKIFPVFQNIDDYRMLNSFNNIRSVKLMAFMFIMGGLSFLLVVISKYYIISVQ